jgi:hypothetical protein
VAPYPPERGYRFVEGRHRHCSGSGHAVSIDGRFDHAGLVVVCGKLWAGRVTIVAELEPGPDAPIRD